jgi:hypothetical protein
MNGVARGSQSACRSLLAGRWIVSVACMVVAAPAAADPPHAAGVKATPAGTPAVLVVTGAGRPVAQADVQLRTPTQPDLKAFTDKAGVVSFVPKSSRYTVRVLARGFATFEAEYPIAPGSRTEIKLRAKTAP